MYYFRKDGRKKILHTKACRYKAAIRADRLDTVKDVRAAVAAGYRFCKCCDPLGRKFQVERQEMLDYSQQHGLSVYWHRRGVGVATPQSRWMIVYADNKVGTELYHRNVFDPKGTLMGCIRATMPKMCAMQICAVIWNTSWSTTIIG